MSKEDEYEVEREPPKPPTLPSFSEPKRWREPSHPGKVPVWPDPVWPDPEPPTIIPLPSEPEKEKQPEVWP